MPYSASAAVAQGVCSSHVHGFVLGRPSLQLGVLTSILFWTMHTQRLHGAAAATVSWKGRREVVALLMVFKRGEKKKEMLQTARTKECRAGREQGRVPPAC